MDVEVGLISQTDMQCLQSNHWIQEGTDGGGIVYQNSWTVDIPFDGFYGLKGTADNGGRILVDGVEQLAGGLGFNRTRPELVDLKLIVQRLRRFS